MSGLGRLADFAPDANIQVSAVPEPGTWAMLSAGLALVGTVGGSGKRRNRAG